MLPDMPPAVGRLQRTRKAVEGGDTVKVSNKLVVLINYTSNRITEALEKQKKQVGMSSPALFAEVKQDGLELQVITICGLCVVDAG